MLEDAHRLGTVVCVDGELGTTVAAELGDGLTAGAALAAEGLRVGDEGLGDLGVAVELLADLLAEHGCVGADDRSHLGLTRRLRDRNGYRRLYGHLGDGRDRRGRDGLCGRHRGSRGRCRGHGGDDRDGDVGERVALRLLGGGAVDARLRLGLEDREPLGEGGELGRFLGGVLGLGGEGLSALGDAGELGREGRVVQGGGVERLGSDFFGHRCCSSAAGTDGGHVACGRLSAHHRVLITEYASEEALGHGGKRREGRYSPSSFITGDTSITRVLRGHTPHRGELVAIPPLPPHPSKIIGTESGTNGEAGQARGSDPPRFGYRSVATSPSGRAPSSPRHPARA